MAYNGFWADFLFNTGVVAAWCVFLWRVLDGPRFSWWGTALLTLVIDAAYLLPVLLLTTAGSALRLLLYPTGALALAFLLFRGTPGRKLLAVAAELTASVLVEMLFSAVAIRAADLQMDAQYAVWADPHAVLYGGVFLLFLALVLLVVSLPFLRARNNLSGRQLLVFSAFPVTQILCSVAIQALIFYPPRYEYTSVLLVVTALFLVSDSLLFRTIMVRTEQRVQLEVENELLESQLAHYGDLTVQYEQIRAMRHDISHHLNTIHALLEAGNLQAASEYSKQLLPAQTYSSRLGSCRNPVVDAFLYTRTQEAGLRGVPVRADVSLPVELPVSNTDLIVAFGNLLDNALEACSGIPDAAITLRAHMDKGYLVIQESNPVRPRQPQGKKPRRIPELERGVGFRVLGSLAKKYDGSFRHMCENDTYTVTLSLRAG